MGRSRRRLSEGKPESDDSGATKGGIIVGFDELEADRSTADDALTTRSLLERVSAIRWGGLLMSSVR